MRKNSLQLSIFFRKQLPVALLLVLMASSASLAQAQQPSALQSAREAMEANQYSAAEQFYRKALAQAPSSAGVMTGLGSACKCKTRGGRHALLLAGLEAGYVPETYALLAQENAPWATWMASGPCWEKSIARKEKIFASFPR